MNTNRRFMRRARLICAMAASTVLSSAACAQTLLVDFGSDTSFRGLSVINPDTNGNYWNSLQPGLFVENLIDVGNMATAIDIGWDTPVATDSYNGPAGPTDASTLETDVMFTEIDAAALGNLGGSFEGVFDFAAGFNGEEHFPVRFQIQNLNPSATYDLTFFGSHAFSDDSTTVYSIYTDSTYTTPVTSTTLLVQDPFFEHNQDRLATIEGVSPQTDNILYVEFVGETGKGGYLNAMQIEATAGPIAGDYNNDGNVDGEDLGVWKAEFGDAGDAVAADGDGDDDADGADLLIWQRNLETSTASPSFVAIPEPGAFGLVATGLLVAPIVRRRRSSK